MKQIAIVSVFIICNNKLLILKRSNQVATHRCLWAAISGYLETDYPILQAYEEIREETAISFRDLRLLCQAPPVQTQHLDSDIEWNIYAFLFAATKELPVSLNWENTDYAWVNVEHLDDYETVPNLTNFLRRLLDMC